MSEKLKGMSEENETDDRRHLDLTETEAYVLDLAGAAKTRSEWVIIMNFGMDWFLKNRQDILLKAIALRAEKEAVQPHNLKGEASDYLGLLFAVLGLDVTKFNRPAE